MEEEQKIVFGNEPNEPILSNEDSSENSLKRKEANLAKYGIIISLVSLCLSIGSIYCAYHQNEITQTQNEIIQNQTLYIENQTRFIEDSLAIQRNLSESQIYSDTCVRATEEFKRYEELINLQFERRCLDYFNEDYLSDKGIMSNASLSLARGDCSNALDYLKNMSTKGYCVHWSEPPSVEQAEVTCCLTSPNLSLNQSIIPSLNVTYNNSPEGIGAGPPELRAHIFVLLVFIIFSLIALFKIKTPSRYHRKKS